MRLSGTVDARRASVVASEVAGLVIEMIAREGDLVPGGKPLARLRSETVRLDLQAKEAELKEAMARLDLARQDLRRTRELHDSGVLSRQSLDAAVSELTAWQGRADRLQAEIAKARDDLDRATIVAPFTGFVVRERTDLGQWINKGGPVLELVDLQTPAVVVDVPERYFKDLRQANPVKLTFDALPGLVVEGKITAIIPQADPQARTFPVRISFANPDYQVGIGMLADVVFPLGDSSRAVIVPKDALLHRGGQVLLLRLDGDDLTEQLEVEPGRAVKDWVEIRGGLSAGDRVITRGNERLRPGQKVTAREIVYSPP